MDKDDDVHVTLAKRTKGLVCGNRLVTSPTYVGVVVVVERRDGASGKKLAIASRMDPSIHPSIRACVWVCAC